LKAFQGSSYSLLSIIATAIVNLLALALVRVGTRAACEPKTLDPRAADLDWGRRAAEFALCAGVCVTEDVGLDEATVVVEYLVVLSTKVGDAAVEARANGADTSDGKRFARRSSSWGTRAWISRLL